VGGTFSMRSTALRRPLIQYPRSLPDGQPDPRPVLYRLRKNVASFVEIIAGIEQAIDLHAVARPFLDFVDLAPE
jgi:hypothetical protein